MCRFARIHKSRFITRCKSAIIATVLYFILFLEHANARAHSLHDYPEAVATEPETPYPSGSFVELTCVLKSCQNNTNIFRWEFKSCAPDSLHKTHCHSNKINDWAVISNVSQNRYCSSIFLIQNSTPDDSGLYRCSAIFPDSKKIKIIKVYHIYVVGRLRITDKNRPSILDVHPVNTTAVENTKIVVHCRVFSIVPPNIWWVKHLNSPVSNTNFIPYNNKSYLTLKTSQKELSLHTYISKLIIEKSSFKDSGIYTCLALNIFGNCSRDVYVNVEKLEQDSEGTTSFFTLFLIPLVFALVPLSVWLCVYYYRKKKMNEQLLVDKANNVNSDLFYKYQPVLSRCNNNGGSTMPSQRIV